MKLISHRAWIWLLLAVSLVCFWQYLKQREVIFQIPPPGLDLSQTPSKDELQNAVYPFLDLSSVETQYSIDTFTDRNAIKFLQQTQTRQEFETTVKNENIPLWGWEVRVRNPIQATILISQRRHLIGLEIHTPPKAFKPFSDGSKIWELLQNKTEKDFSSHPVQSGAFSQDLKFRREVPGTNLIESISAKFDRGTIQSFKSTILLPNTYASEINQTIEKQKTLHQFFNIFHYMLIGLIFLFLFRAYENKKLSWKRNVLVFLVLFFAQWVAFIFRVEFHELNWISIFQTLIKTIGHTAWMFALIVTADFIGRVYPQSKYTLSDIFSRPFFASHHFRNALMVGWILFIAQISIVGLFYYVYQHIGAYVPLKIPGEHSIQSALEFIRYFSESLSTSIYEEVLYRLFLICFFGFIFKRTGPAIILSSVLWGFLHFSYQFEPYYVRGLELTLVGLVYGWVMIRYGILAVVFGHFFYNSFVMSEYEYLSIVYMGAIFCLTGLALFFSKTYQRKHPLFVFEHADFPETTNTISISADRRNILRRIYPLNWKYGLISLLVLLFILTRIPFGAQHTPVINNKNLIQASGSIIKAYYPGNVWDVTYHKSNDEIKNVYQQIKQSQHRKELTHQLDPYSYLWSVRYFSQAESNIICDLDYSQNYELLQLECTPSSAAKLSFEEWVRLVKDPDETWTLFDVESQGENIAVYQYNIATAGPQHPTKKIFLVFQDGQLRTFKKNIGIAHLDPQVQTSQLNLKIISIVLSIVAVGILVGFFRFFFKTANRTALHDKKSWIAVGVSCFLFVLWKLNSYRDLLIDFDQVLTLKHYILNSILVSLIKLIGVAAITYPLFYGFFHFPSLVFKHVPSSSEWNGILSRPIWKWRNTKVSLLYAALLLCIQTLLRLLVQINNGIPSLDLFHFDVSLFNHEYMFITFICLAWKSMLFWCGLMIVITIFEKYFPRWAYLLILSSVVLINVLISNDGLDSKLIEICGIYIVFYFIYNIARFDFAFYFWFILLNTLVSFLPLLLYSQYGSYFYQVVFIFIFVITIVLYTLFRSRNVNVQVQG